MKKRNKQHSRDWISSTCHVYEAKKDDMTVCRELSKLRKEKGANPQWNKEYQRSEGRKQVVIETQWPQWITTFPTVIETICSLHTELLTNSSLYFYLKYQNRPFHWPDSCFIASALAPSCCFHTRANSVLCGSDWLSQATGTHSCMLWVPKWSPYHILIYIHKALTNGSYQSSVQAAVISWPWPKGFETISLSHS